MRHRRTTASDPEVWSEDPVGNPLTSAFSAP